MWLSTSLRNGRGTGFKVHLGWEHMLGHSLSLSLSLVCQKPGGLGPSLSHERLSLEKVIRLNSGLSVLLRSELHISSQTRASESSESELPRGSIMAKLTYT